MALAKAQRSSRLRESPTQSAPVSRACTRSVRACGEYGSPISRSHSTPTSRSLSLLGRKVPAIVTTAAVAMTTAAVAPVGVAARAVQEAMVAPLGAAALARAPGPGDLAPVTQTLRARTVSTTHRPLNV